MLRAYAHAQAACVTFITAHRERLAIAVKPRLHSRNQRERSLVLVVEPAHLEDVVRASPDAVFLGLA